jgi:hypothetical protein
MPRIIGTHAGPARRRGERAAAIACSHHRVVEISANRARLRISLRAHVRARESARRLRVSSIGLHIAADLADLLENPPLTPESPQPP